MFVFNLGHKQSFGAKITGSFSNLFFRLLRRSSSRHIFHSCFFHALFIIVFLLQNAPFALETLAFVPKVLSGCRLRSVCQQNAVKLLQQLCIARAVRRFDSDDVPSVCSLCLNTRQGSRRPLRGGGDAGSKQPTSATELARRVRLAELGPSERRGTAARPPVSPASRWRAAEGKRTGVCLGR